MVGVDVLATSNLVMSFVHYAQDQLRLSQIPGFTPLNLVVPTGFEPVTFTMSR